MIIDGNFVYYFLSFIFQLFNVDLMLLIGKNCKEIKPRLQTLNFHSGLFNRCSHFLKYNSKWKIFLFWFFKTRIRNLFVCKKIFDLYNILKDYFNVLPVAWFWINFFDKRFINWSLLTYIRLALVFGSSLRMIIWR